MNITRKMCMMSIMKHWNKLSGDVKDSPSLEIFITKLPRVTRCHSEFGHIRAVAEQEDLQRSFQKKKKIALSLHINATLKYGFCVLYIVNETCFKGTKSWLYFLLYNPPISAVICFKDSISPVKI